MANEFSENFNVSVANGNYKWSFVKGQASYNQVAMGAVGGLATVTTSSTAIPLGSVTTLGKAMIHNCDATNYIQIGITVSAVFYPVVRLKPDEYCWLRLDSGATLYWKANTASCETEYQIFQE